MNSNHRRRIFSLLLVLGALGAIFLAGPSGLINLSIKLHRLDREKKRISLLKAEADSLREKIKLWQNPDYATRAAQQLLNLEPTTGDSTE